MDAVRRRWPLLAWICLPLPSISRFKSKPVTATFFAVKSQASIGLLVRGEKKVAVTGLDLKREMDGNGRLAGSFHPDSSSKNDFAAYSSITNPQLIARGLERKKSRQILRTGKAGS